MTALIGIEVTVEALHLVITRVDFMAKRQGLLGSITLVQRTLIDSVQRQSCNAKSEQSEDNEDGLIQAGPSKRHWGEKAQMLWGLI